MTYNKHNYCVILAGGRGKRMWPESRESFPKQFLDITCAGSTLLQQTYDRVSKIISKENIIITTNKNYVELVKAQLPDFDEQHILGEPVQRNTAPSLCWANHHITTHDPDARVLVIPSDQLIKNEEKFLKCIEDGLELVSREDVILTIGEKPVRPEPGYGYIQKGDINGLENVYHVKSFSEKPTRELAQMFIDSGEFYWNTGIFLGSNKTLREAFIKVLPPIMREYDKEFSPQDAQHEQDYIMQHFPSYPNMSIDEVVLELTENVYVMVCEFGWADVGSWHSLYECFSRGTKENIIFDSNIFADDSESNIVKIPKDKLAVINGLKDFIVIETDDVLLICKKEDSSALIKKYQNEIGIKYGGKYN